MLQFITHAAVYYTLEMHWCRGRTGIADGKVPVDRPPVDRGVLFPVVVSRLSSKPPSSARSRRSPYLIANPECFERIVRYPSTKDGQTIRVHNRRRHCDRRLACFPTKSSYRSYKAPSPPFPLLEAGAQRRRGHR